MAKEMLINVSAGEECRIALLEDGRLEELYMERTSNTSHVGNIYKGKVTNVEPSIQAAFVDFGIGRNGFLHISDLMPTYFGKKGENAPAEKVGQKLGRRDRPPIQQCLRKGDEIVVQIIKEGLGTKGPTLSTYLSIPGRVLVMMPGMAKMGVSKKIEDEDERSRLRKILDSLTPPRDCGFIIRTAGIGKSKIEIERDLKYLARLWEQLKKQIDHDKPPVELYTEGDLITRSVRDVFTSDVDSIIVDDADTAKKIKDFIKLAMPRTKNKVELYDDVVPLFHKYELEGKVEAMYSRRVPLPSGGSLIIDQTEAVVAIDVNSGKFRDHSDAETTAFKTDMEAADEIPRQLRLRDMGGVIICDFIDLRFERHRRELEERLFENLKQDRAKTRMLRMSQFGIIEMTRQRMRPSLRKAIYHDCHSCAGQGMVKTPESMALDVMRKLRIALNDAAVIRATLTVHPEVATYLQNRKRYEIAKLEQVTDKTVAIAADADMSTDETKFELYDSRDGFIYIAELGMALPTSHGQQRRDSAPERGRRDEKRREPAKAKHDRREDESVDKDDLYAEEGEQPPVAKPQGRGRGRGANEAPMTGAIAPTDEIKQTGNDDEGGAVDVDEGGDEMPGFAPGGFEEPNNRFNDRGRDRDRGRGRGRNERGRGGDRRPDNRGPDNRNDANRDENRVDDNRNDADRGDNNRDEGRNEGRGDNRGDNRNADNRNDRNDRDNRGPSNRPPLQRPPAARPDVEAGEIDEEVDELTEISEGQAAEAGDGDANEGLFEGQSNESEGGENNEPRFGPDGQPLPREGGKRRRRRRGRRGRGRGPDGEAGDPNAPQGDRAESERPANEAQRPQQPRDDRQRDDRPREDRPQGDRQRNDRQRNEGQRNEGQRDDNRRNEGQRDEGRRDEGQRDEPQRDRQPRQPMPPQQGGRGQGGQGGGQGRFDRRGPQGGGDGRRGSSRADLSGLARDIARQDAEHDANPQDAGPQDATAHAANSRKANVDPAEDDHATPGNDINFVPKPREEPAGRGGRGGRGGGRAGGRQGRGRGPVTPKRSPPLEGLPNDEELDREAAALEAALAKAREAEMTPPADHVGHVGHAPAKPAAKSPTPKATAVKLPSPIKIPKVAPTGSTDSHLADDEPADGEDVKPPSSYTDLDALPDYEDD